MLWVHSLLWDIMVHTMALVVCALQLLSKGVYVSGYKTLDGKSTQ